MNAFVSLTDRDWFDFLAVQPNVDEVNCWQPHRGAAIRRAEERPSAEVLRWHNEKGSVDNGFEKPLLPNQRNPRWRLPQAAKRLYKQQLAGKSVAC